jgi:hypothetical protein
MFTFAFYHFIKLAPGTNKDVKSLLNRSYEILIKKTNNSQSLKKIRGVGWCQ